jgi:hypothetical protein
MNIRRKSVLFWVLSLLLMLTISAYQRLTGPTKPLRGSVNFQNTEIPYKLIRTWGDDSPAQIEIDVKNTEVQGFYVFRRFKSHDEWDTLSMIREGEMLMAKLPQLPPAGKMMYHIILWDDQKEVMINEEPAVLRYKGHVPSIILIPHIFFMFFAMLLSMRTGFEALFIRKNTYSLSLLTLAFLLAGGLILGPVVQKYAFDAYWTGWPFGHDLTDNKTIVAFIFWLIAFFVLRKNRKNRFWPAFAAAILLAVYMIPHSVLGSEIDFTAENTKIESQK